MSEIGRGVPRWLAGAGRSPSAHNTQPWVFTARGEGVYDIGWKPERSLAFSDPTGRDLYLALGAAVESAVLSSCVSDTPLRFESAAPDDPTSVGMLVPHADRPATTELDRGLESALHVRQTARAPHLRRTVDPSSREALVAEAASFGLTLRMVTERFSVRSLARLAGRATAATFADASVHAELWRWLRLDPRDPAYRRDGLTADCLELRGAALAVARLAMPPPRMRALSRLGIHHLLGADTAGTARQSASICLLLAPSTDRPTLVRAGRVLQRLWLLAATRGLTTHPLSVLLDRPEAVAPTLTAFGGEPGDGLAPVAVFRLGYTPPAARSPRLPISELMESVG